MICLTICKASSASCRVRQMMTKSSAYRMSFPRARIPLRPVHIQHMQVDVCQQGTDDAALGRANLRGIAHTIFQNTRFEPLPNEFQHSPVTNPPFEQRHQHGVVNRVKVTLNVGVYHPPTRYQSLLHHSHRLLRAALWAKPIRVVTGSWLQRWVQSPSCMPAAPPGHAPSGYPTVSVCHPLSGCRRATLGSGGSVPAFKSCSIWPRNCSTPSRSTSSMVTPSSPALPPFRRTSSHACLRMSGR